MKLCDLHTHSNFSDGTCTPEQIVEMSLQLGLSAVALCDHNTVDGLPAFLEAAAGTELEAIAGAEFSVDYRGTELHLLGLYIPPHNFPRVSELMTDVLRQKEESNRALLEALNRAGYRLDYDYVLQKTQGSSFNRAHVAAALAELGYAPDPDTAFQTLLRPEVGHYRPPQRLDFFFVLDFLRKLGAVPVLAHPLLQMDARELMRLLPPAKSHGLLGLECAYSTYDDMDEIISRTLADKFHLCYSGGSDFHGGNKPKISLGTGEGNLQVPYTWAQRLKELANPSV